jgi:hypothetical protein
MKAKVKYPIGMYAQGHYWCTCVDCKEEFIGDKLARQCEPCAINMVNELCTKYRNELFQLKQSLKNVVLNYDKINEILNKEVKDESK